MGILLNQHFDTMKQNYLFSEIGKRVSSYTATHPDAKVIRLGIGDVTLPLTPCVIRALHHAVDEMANRNTFRGYAPEYGYDFIRQAVSDFYARRNVSISPSEIFVSDGAKSDIGNLVDIFGDNPVVIPDPVYPAYLDSNLISGRSVSFIKANMENHFLPMPDVLDGQSAILYLCSPNNPTGAVYNHQQLAQWVRYAMESESVIIFDSAYEAYIRGNYPHSIYEIDGAKQCAIEICSLSKSAGFTGTRCAWTVIPDELIIDQKKVAHLWARRQATKFNGVPYVIQRAAEAALSEEGQKECAELVCYYMENARLIADVLHEKKIWFTGGVCSPYIWLKCPSGMDSWTFFDDLLQRLQIVGTPGAGFGLEGDGFFRLTSFGSREATLEAVERIRTGL